MKTEKFKNYICHKCGSKFSCKKTYKNLPPGESILLVEHLCLRCVFAETRKNRTPKQKELSKIMDAVYDFNWSA